MIVRIHLENLTLPKDVAAVILTGGPAYPSSTDLGSMLIREEFLTQDSRVTSCILDESLKLLKLTAVPDSISEGNSGAVSDLCFNLLYGVVGGDTFSCQDSLPLLKADPPEFTCEDIVRIYNAQANRMGWVRVRSISERIRRYLLPALKKHANEEYWETVMAGWESDEFFSGRSGALRNIKIMTMLHKGRHEDFYEDGLLLKGEKEKKESFLADIDAAFTEPRDLKTEFAASLVRFQQESEQC